MPQSFLGLWKHQKSHHAKAIVDQKVSYREHTSKADFYWHLLFSAPKKLGFEVPWINRTDPAVCSNGIRSAQEPRSLPRRRSAEGSAVAPAPAAGHIARQHCPAFTADTQRQPQRWCQEHDSSSSCPRPHGHHALLYPIIGSLLAALTQESPRGPWGNITGRRHRRSELWRRVPSTNSCASKQLPGPGCFPLVH